MSSRDDASLGASPSNYDSLTSGGAPPTYATFSPVTLSANTPSRSSRRSTVLVHQKSPLLLATPPQITRALAYSHPFLLPLNTLAGLLTWSTGDPWQSFLLVCAYWGIVLYGDVILMWAGPVVVGVALILGMYSRRYSPLSTSGFTEPPIQSKDAASKPRISIDSIRGNGAEAAAQQARHKRGNSEVTNTKHQKTLDEIVETLKEFTGRCNVLLDPLIEMTDFLSTQRTPTSATTRPALTAMFMRLLIITPIWIAMTIPPWRIITSRRVMLVGGTLLLTWHARVMRVSRAIIWRSATVRRLAAAITGLRFEAPVQPFQKEIKEAAEKGEQIVVAKQQESELTKQLRQPRNSLQTNHKRSGGSKTAGVKFTFIIYENQRRWIGLGWTSSLFAYERPAWTDEHSNAVPPKDDFELPEVEDGSQMVWRWVPGSRWRVDGVADELGPVEYDSEEGINGWIFYDNKWQNGKRGVDGWARWTRRRKWYRDAELVEVDVSERDSIDSRASRASRSVPVVQVQGYNTSDEMMIPMRAEPHARDGDKSHGEDSSLDDASSRAADDALSVQSTSSRSFFRTPLLRKRATDRSSMDKERTRRTSLILNEDDSSGLGTELTLQLQKQGKEGGEWGIGDEARMSLE